METPIEYVLNQWQPYVDDETKEQILNDAWKELSTLKSEIDRLRSGIVEAVAELKHASIFIRTKEKMHPAGQGLYDELLVRLESLIGKEK